MSNLSYQIIYIFAKNTIFGYILIDTKIVNCKVVTPTGIISAGVGIKNDKIVALAHDPNLPRADRTIDAGGKYVIPGVVDPHVHLAATVPASQYENHLRTFQRDCRTNSESAVACGTTTYGHFFYAGPEKKYNKKMVDDFKEGVERNAMIDIFFHASMGCDDHIQQIPDLAELGITSFKFFFTAYKGPDGIFADLRGTDDGQLFAGLDKIGELRDRGYQGTTLIIHAENQDIIYKLREKFQKEGRRDLAVWSDHRPSLCEEECISRAIYIAKAVKLVRPPPPLYIAHLSSGRSLDIISKASSEIEVIAETCPQWLLLTKHDQKLGSLAKVNPPLRDKEDNERLWWGIRKGIIKCMGSEHIASLPLELKPPDIWKAYPGFPGEGLLQLMLSEGVNKGRISLKKLVEICCSNPAKVFGIFPKKGIIDVGSDADLVIVDMNKKAKVTLEALHSPAGFSVYEGWQLKGWPVLTMVRGNIVMEDGEIIGKPGTGKYLPRKKLSSRSARK